jgi:hypothetical protein
VNLHSDSNNCGTTCGNKKVCDHGHVCINGACVCPGEQIDCATFCTDVSNDPGNCGDCAHDCANDIDAPGIQCANRACTDGCPAPLVDCEGACADTATDNLHCGPNCQVCTGGRICSGGACVCGPGRSLCANSNTCVDLTMDPNHCGFCNVAYGTDQLCDGGQCATDICSPVPPLPPPVGREACARSCVDLASDPSNCGACGSVCSGGQVCADGLCGCPAGTMYCTAPGTISAGCFNLDASPSHCGSCGQSCDPGLVCRAGGCVANDPG